MRILITCVVFAFAASCTSSLNKMRHDNLKKQAAADFNCLETQMIMVEMTKTTWGVNGCGQEAVYSYDKSNKSWAKDEAKSSAHARDY